MNELAPGETIVAMLPFATVPKLPKGPEGRISVGIRQSWRRYRPLVFTNRRLFVFDSGKTPHPRQQIGEFPLVEIELLEVRDARFGQKVMVLELPAHRPIPFELGKRELDDLATVTTLLRPNA